MNGDRYGVAEGGAIVSPRRCHLAYLSLLSKERLLSHFAAVFALWETMHGIMYIISICK